MSYRTQSKSFLRQAGLPTSQEEAFNKIYLATKIKLGIINEAMFRPSFDAETGYTPAISTEGLVDSLLDFANLALKYLGHGLYALSERTFDSIRTQSEKIFMSYPTMVTTWKSRIWENSRDIDGRKFDAYTIKVVPHAVMVKRINAVEQVHKALNSIGAIYNAPVPKTSDDWTTPECAKAISALEKIGFDAGSLDMLGTISKQYENARKKQAMYLHGYTPKRLLDIMTRCEKLAEYGDIKYVQRFEEQYLKHVDSLEDDESETSTKKIEEDPDTAQTKSKTSKIAQEEHEEKIRAARLWWLAHFLKAAYQITTDILSDVETLMTATSRCVITPSGDEA